MAQGKKRIDLYVDNKKINDTCWQWDFYQEYGPLYRSEQTKDSERKILHGTVRYYNEDGILDSIATYRNGRKHGEFQIPVIIPKVAYKNVNSKANQKEIDPASHQVGWDIYAYNNGIMESKKENRLVPVNEQLEIPDTSNKQSVHLSDSAKKLQMIQVESEYPGGDYAWKRYLLKNLRYPERAQIRETTGMVVVGFIVSSEGNVEAIQIFKSVEYSLDEEAMLVIRKSGKWSPAIQNGRPVKSYKMMPIVFQLAR